ncbi:MAG: hypothetical protein P8016_02575 [Sedimentisphaerales bacterium]
MVLSDALESISDNVYSMLNPALGSTGLARAARRSTVKAQDVYNWIS